MLNRANIFVLPATSSKYELSPLKLYKKALIKINYKNVNNTQDVHFINSIKHNVCECCTVFKINR